MTPYGGLTAGRLGDADVSAGKNASNLPLTHESCNDATRLVSNGRCVTDSDRGTSRVGLQICRAKLSENLFRRGPAEKETGRPISRRPTVEGTLRASGRALRTVAFLLGKNYVLLSHETLWVVRSRIDSIPPVYRGCTELRDECGRDLAQIATEIVRRRPRGIARLGGAIRDIQDTPLFPVRISLGAPERLQRMPI